ncbi:MAG: transglutaminase domain-containing protein [Micrococcales bacterium]|nr:transglutaminase domain-containing protein [Micrococcales bacterium]
MTPPRTPGFTVTTVLFAWLALAVAVTPWWPIYQDGRFVLVVVAAIVLGTLPAVVGALARWPSWLVLLGAVALFLLSGVQLAIPAQTLSGGLIPTVTGLRTLVAELALGWRQLLTITIPVGDYQALLVPVYAAVFAATTVAISLALRVRWGELAAVPVLAVFVLGIAFGPDAGGVALPFTLAEIGIVLLWLVWRGAVRRRAAIRRLTARTRAAGETVPPRSERSLAVRSVAGAAVILMIASIASVAAAQAVPPGRDRAVLRTGMQLPFEPRDYPSPLSSFRSYLRGASADATMLTVRGLPAGGLIRIATLDEYDGVVYAVGSGDADGASGTFTRVPTSVDQSGATGDRIQVEVRVGAYSGVWVPTVGDLETVDFRGENAARLRDAFYFNQATGTAAVIGGVQRGDSYRTSAIQPVGRDLDAVKRATPGAAPVPAIAALPDALSVKLESYDRGVDGAGAQLVAAIQGLKRDGYISHGLTAQEPASRSGHAADRITELVSAPRMIGDAEQYSVAAALMARQLGFPARVVFGFAPQGQGSVAVRGSDVSAWIEVNTSQAGWVAIDPVPPVRPIPDELPQQPTQISRPQTPVEPPPDDPLEREAQSPQDSTRSDDTGQDPVLVALLAGLRVAAGVLAVAGLIALPLLVVVTAKGIRRLRRRRRGPPARRITAAWDEFRDEAVDYGYALASSATRFEFAEQVGLEQSKTLAAVVDRAVFAPGAPGRTDADRVWTALEEISDSLGRGLTRWQRFRSRISLRSLRARGRSGGAA